MAQQPQLGPKSAAYRQGLGNVDATASTVKNVAALGVFSKYGLIISLVLIVLLIGGIIYIVWKFKDTIFGALKTVAAPINNTAAAVAAEHRTGQLSQLDQTQIDRMAEDIADAFTWYTGKSRVTSISNNLLSLQAHADWDRLLTAYGQRKCCNYHWIFDGKASLPQHITRHFNADEKTVVRAHLYSIGVTDPGF